jgi:hypothetical protein
MEEEWSISMPFVPANLEDATLQIHDEEGEVHREDLTGWEKNNGSGVKGRLVEVVHGFKAEGGGTPCTLIVFEWLLVPGKRCNRLKDVRISVAFRAIGTRPGVRAGGSLSAWDPVPIKLVPYEPLLTQFSKVSVSEKLNKELGAQVGYQPYAAVTPKIGKETSFAVERIDYRYITGSKTYVGKNSGSSNGVEWKLEENKSLKSGVQYVVRTAVLLRRKPFDFEKFNLTVEVEANGSFTKHVADQFFKAVGIRPTDGPAAFDPMVEPAASEEQNTSDDIAARPTKRDWKNLGDVDLTEVLLKDEDLKELADAGKKDDAPKTQVVEIRIKAGETAEATTESTGG